MPTVFRSEGVRFFFYSNEGNPREPIHVHAEADEGEAKIWLRPRVRVASSVGFSRQRLATLVRIVEEHGDDIERAWHEHFG